MAKKHITLEDLAGMVKHGFDEVHERLDQTATHTELSMVKTELSMVRTELKKDIHQLEQKIDEGFFAVNRRIDLLHEDISDLPAIREELKDHDDRLVQVERKVSVRK